jgi:hypothetical protein
VSQIKSLRSPNINAQIIQQRAFLPYRDLYGFLAKHHEQLAEEIGQAYINTMRWYYSSQFTRYELALEKIPLYTVDKHDALGLDHSSQRSKSFSLERYRKLNRSICRCRLKDYSTCTRRPLTWPSHRCSQAWLLICSPVPRR